MSGTAARARWRMLLVLFVARTSLAFQVQVIASVSVFLAAELALDLIHIGTLIGLAMLPGVLLALPSGFAPQLARGRVVDKAIVLGGLALMSLGALVCAVAQDYALLALGRVLGGVGIVLNIVYMAKMTTDWFAGREIATDMSILVTSWPLGFALAQAIQPAVAELWGWRAVPALSAAVSAACLLLVWLAYRAPAAADTPEEVVPVRWLPWPTFVLISLAGLIWTLLNVGYLVYLSFAPLALISNAVEAVAANRVVSVASWAMLVSIPAAGWLADRTGRGDRWLALGTVAAVLALALLPLLDAPLLLCFVFGALGVAPAGIIMSLPAAVLAPRERALAMGVFYSWYYAGMALGPAAAGLVADARGVDAALFFAAALFVALGGCHWLFRGLAREFAAVRAEPK